MDELSKKERRTCELNTLDDVKQWLHSPENQIKTELYIIKWDGATPSIATGPRNRLAELDNDDALATVVLLEHRRRKFRPRTEDEEMPHGNDE
jgi:hypothetical protein